MKIRTPTAIHTTTTVQWVTSGSQDIFSDYGFTTTIHTEQFMKMVSTSNCKSSAVLLNNRILAGKHLTFQMSVTSVLQLHHFNVGSFFFFF